MYRLEKTIMVEPWNELERTAQAVASCMPCQLCPEPCKAREHSSMANCVRHWMVIMKDAVNVQSAVRYKDYKRYQFADNRAFGFPAKRCEWTGFEDVDDDYCSRGERRNG